MVRYEFGRDEHELKELPKLNLVPIEEILHQHDKRYIFKTEKYGDLVLRWLPQRMRKILDVMRAFRYPSFPVLEEEMRILAPILDSEDCDEETKTRALQLNLELLPSFDIYFLGVIEYPCFTSMDELDSFFDELNEEEQQAFRQVLMMLTSAVPPIDDLYLAVGMKFNVQIVDKHMMDHMTRQQYEIFESLLETEKKMTEKMYKEIGKI